MAIMSTAMSRGRTAAFALAAGVITISWTWATLASTGLAALLLTYPKTLYAIQIVVGGSYLIYLAVIALRAALQGKDLAKLAETQPSRAEFRMFNRRGVLIHVANPKAVMAWVATISLGLQPGAPAYRPFVILLGYAVLSVIIFSGYAIVFSFPVMSRPYANAQRWIDGGLALFFAGAGLTLVQRAITEAGGYLATGR
ncbi:LysE family translocator [Mesorhizobium sp. STM 4661]|uniref:LysE family translocator n=1 Tax=Mesorhizobium sp. STM 4661 TaxID=1297570 RepID=UPI000685AAC2|nr:LysE family translocator [Mesorhizobium sp. STM 4661]